VRSGIAIPPAHFAAHFCLRAKRGAFFASAKKCEAKWPPHFCYKKAVFARKGKSPHFFRFRFSFR